MPAQPKSLVGEIVDVEWSDAFDEAETHPEELTDEYLWHTYGKVLRDTPEYITVATSEGGVGKDQQVCATTILKCMVRNVEVL